MMSLSSLTLAFIAALAFVLDRALGEPKKFHPLVGLGRWAKFVERLLWQPFCEVPVSIPTSSPNTSRKFLVLMSGFVAWCAVLLPVVVLLTLLIGILPEPLMLDCYIDRCLFFDCATKLGRTRVGGIPAIRRYD